MIWINSKMYLQQQNLNLKIFAVFVLSTHFAHGNCLQWYMARDDEEEIDCNLKKVRPASTSFVNVSWKKIAMK